MPDTVQDRPHLTDQLISSPLELQSLRCSLPLAQRCRANASELH